MNDKAIDLSDIERNFKTLITTNNMQEINFVEFDNRDFEEVKYNEYFILCLITLHRMVMRNKTIDCNLLDIIKYNNFKPQSGKNRNIEKFKDCLFRIMVLGYFKFCNNSLPNISYWDDNGEVKSDEEIEKDGIIVNKFKDLLGNTDRMLLFFDEKNYRSIVHEKGFTQIYYSQIDKLLEIAEETKLSATTLINIYCYMLCRYNQYIHFNTKDKIRNTKRPNINTKKGVAISLKEFNNKIGYATGTLMPYSSCILERLSLL